MQNSQNKKALQIGLFVLVAIVVLGVGYAAISAVNLIINGNATASVDQNNFKVHFTQAQAISGSTGASGTSTIDSQDDTKATFDVTGLTKVGDYAEAVYTVRNDSNGIGAEITLNLESSNTEYFKVTETILDNKLQAGDSTTATIRVEMIKTPITDAVSTSITATLTASPLEDAQASGGEEKSKIEPKPYTYVYSGETTDWIKSGINIPNELVTYNNYDEAINSYGKNRFIKYNILDNVIDSMEIGFKIDNNIYYLKDTSNYSHENINEENIKILKEVFGQENCNEIVRDNGIEYMCQKNGLRVSIGAIGRACGGGTKSVLVSEINQEYGCYACDSGSHMCFKN